MSAGGRLLAAFLRHELLVQLRSLRFRVVVGGWVAVASMPALVVFLRRRVGLPAGAATYLAETLPWLVPLTMAASFVVSSDGVLREREQGTWSTLSLCGMSTAGYVLRRWVSLVVPLLVASALPVLAAGLFATAAGHVVPWSAFAGLWAARVATRVVLASALGLGFGTAAGGLFAGAGLAAVTLLGGLLAIDGLLFRWRLHLGGIPLDLQPLFRSIDRLQSLFGGTAGAYQLPFPLPASDAPIPTTVRAEQAIASLATTAALAALGVAWAILLARRTRPDLRPWQVREGHSLATFVGVAGRLRERFAADARLAPADLAAVVTAVGIAVGIFGAALVRDHRIVRDATARFQLAPETWPGTTAPALLPAAVHITGVVDDRGRLRSESTTMLRNDGDVAIGEVVAVLAPAMRLEALAVAGHEARWQRRRERIAVTLAPPVRPRETIALRAVVAGRPAQTIVALRLSEEYGGYWSFQRAFAFYHYARFARALPDLTPSFTRPAVSPTRVELTAADLLPVVRYTPFGLADRDEYDTHHERADESFPSVPVDVTLRAPRQTWLADACGHVTSGGRLAGGCTLSLPQYVVRGGPQVARREGGLTVALLPGHRALAVEKLGPLAQVADIVHEVWPDEDLARETVLLEVPAPEVFLLDEGLWPIYRIYELGGEHELQAQGRLLVLPEMVLLAAPPLSPAVVAQRLIGARLLERRAVAADQALLFRSLVRTFAALHAGDAPSGGAVLPATMQGPGAYEVSLLAADGSAAAVWERRLPALLLELERRIGGDAVRRGLAAFLARRDAPPGTLAELVGDWERASGVGLRGFYDQYLAGPALPTLSLADVAFASGGDGGGGWSVRGRVRNDGTGESRCSVVLTSDAARSSVDVVAPAGGSGAFSFRSDVQPRAVLLDPDQRCIRYRPLVPVPVERVDYRGAGHA